MIPLAIHTEHIHHYPIIQLLACLKQHITLKLRRINARISLLHISYLLCGISTLTACTTMQANDMSFTPDHSHYYKKDQFLNYREIGEGRKTIILLHGFGASNRTWDDIIPYINTSEFRLILVDLIGAGFSSIPKDSNYSMEANADAVIDLIKSQSINNYILVGHSLGGGIALNIALKLNRATAKAPKPNALILLDSAAYDTGLPFFVDNLRTPIIGQLLLTLTPPSLQAKYTLERIYFDKSKVTEEKINRYAYFFSLPGNNAALIESAKQIIPNNYEELTKQYKTIQEPTLILWGAQDTALSITGGKRLASEMPKAKLIVIDRCGHNSQEEQPSKVALEIEKFLKSIGE